MTFYLYLPLEFARFDIARPHATALETWSKGVEVNRETPRPLPMLYSS